MGFALWPRACLVHLAPVRRDYPRLPLITPDYPCPGAVITSSFDRVARFARGNGNALCRQRGVAETAAVSKAVAVSSAAAVSTAAAVETATAVSTAAVVPSGAVGTAAMCQEVVHQKKAVYDPGVG